MIATANSGSDHSTSKDSSTRYMLAYQSSQTDSEAQPNLTVNMHPMVTRGKRGTVKPKNPFAGCAVTTSIPKTVANAPADLVWYNSMKIEFEALKKNHTWSLIPKSPNMYIVGSKCIFKVKYRPDGSIERHKARLVAQGFSQTPGLDFFDTFSHVIKPSTVRVMLSIAASFN